MSKSKSKPDAAALTATAEASLTTSSVQQDEQGGSFMANLRQALEHIGDAEWLKVNAPLESICMFLANQPTPARVSPIPSIGIKLLDEQMKAIWQDWETREKTGLQALLWAAVRQIKTGRDPQYPALLLLTYFQDPRPKQADLIKQLAVGQSTFYRQLGVAVQALEQSVIALLQPSLRLESPTVKSLIGRADVLHDCLTALHTGSMVSLIGASGLGKTSLGAMLCHAWSDVNSKSKIENRKCFWYTFRLGLTDNVQLLIFALALFLHQQGASNLWLQLIAKPQEAGAGGGSGKALAMICKSLETLKDGPPLFCFDEVDLLLPNELEDSDERQQLRAFLEAFVESSRSGAPVLLIGQRLLMEPERDHVFALHRFGLAETHLLLHSAGLTADESVCEKVLNYTRGNPLLLQLLITLHHLGEPVLHNLTQLSATASLDWFLARLRRHLSAKELGLLEALCVFDAPAPASLWRKQSKVLARLTQLNLIQPDAGDQLSLLPALREALYRQLPADARVSLHLSAAQSCAAQGAFTVAAHHFVLGLQPEMAVWTWHTHRDDEVRQGLAQTAWHIFQSLHMQSLAQEQDRRVLALILADLSNLRGKHEEGLTALNAVQWQPMLPSTARAKELRGKLLMMRGDIDAALAEYRGSLDVLSKVLASKPISLRAEMARLNLVRARDATTARREALLAQHDVEILLGDIEDESGHLEEALTHFQKALALAQVCNNSVRLARANQAIGILEARRLNTDIAQNYLIEASRHYASYGSVINAIGMTTSNSAFAYLMAHRYQEAIAPAQKAIAFFQDMGQPYELSLNEANLAEVYANLGDAKQAEALAFRALAHEEAAVRPQCLYVLGHVRRLQGQFEEAEQYCKEAIASAEANQDPWSSAYAWRTLGEVYRDWDKPQAAHETFEKAVSICNQIGLTQEVGRLNEQLAKLPRDS